MGLVGFGWVFYTTVRIGKIVFLFFKVFGLEK